MKLEEVKEDLGQGISLQMVLIPASTFMMGSPKSEKGRPDKVQHVDNEVQHEVTITNPYYMGKYEVTQEQWEAVMGRGFLWFGGNPSSTKGAKLPVTNVSWEDCQEFIKKLNAKTAGGYRLPTEAEWEYACRAGTTTAYSFGNEITHKDANIYNNIGKPVAVGSYKPNAFGLYDMYGNVREWCEDWYQVYLKEPVTDPKEPAGMYRIERGGSFFMCFSLYRSSGRGYLEPATRKDDVGFRLARTR